VIRRVVVGAPAGLHARVAAVVARAAAGTPAPVTVRAPGRPPVPADSVVGLLTLGAAQGAELVLESSGGGAAAALHRIATLLESDAAPSSTDRGVRRG
jgi:phosphocarrier protein HPr